MYQPVINMLPLGLYFTTKNTKQVCSKLVFLPMNGLPICFYAAGAHYCHVSITPI